MTAYTPSWLPQPNTAYAVEVARRIGFATVILLDTTDPAVSHIPVQVDPGDDERPLTLFFHVAAHNAIAERIDDDSRFLVVFRAVDGYISPTWYDHENVPTWNYAAVHMYGGAEPLTDSGLRAHLGALLDHHEPALEVREEFIEQYLPDIRGFRMTTPRVEPAFKLSQDKNRPSFDGALAGVRARQEGALADEMANLRRQLGDGG
ncbi:FMN-binding negative transcriptional regulator [Streptomyces sp. NPDC059679]|uniref:FMN-binding negative transcriptional regulator n=1 Tax=Streptomyces sp. NPDC059679 TaxID=3346903 RepID=UPI0036AE22F6